MEKTSPRIETNTLKKAEDKGREEGILLGEKKRNLEIAQRMLQQGFSIEQVTQITGLAATDLNTDSEE